MSFAIFGKIIFFLLWPMLFLLVIYFNDKEKFKQRLKRFKWKDW